MTILTHINLTILTHIKLIVFRKIRIFWRKIDFYHVFGDYCILVRIEIRFAFAKVERGESDGV